MKITRNLDSDGTLGPAALNYLAGIPAQCLFHVQHQLRHPASIYNVSLDTLCRRFLNVADKYVEATGRFKMDPKSGSFDLEPLLEAQEYLLRSAQDHLADCYLILKTLVDPARTKAKTIHAEEYVLASKLPGAKSFGDATADYKTSLRITNKLKHNQGRLRGIGVCPDSGETVSLGYFLEEPDKDGVLGPSPEIHPNRGAFSFARDLKWRLFLVYSLSESLVRTIDRALLGAHGVRLSRTVPQQQDGEWSRLVTVLSGVHGRIFPKEQRASVATVTLEKDGHHLSIKFPDRIRVLVHTSGSARVVLLTKGDGFSRQFKLPAP